MFQLIRHQVGNGACFEWLCRARYALISRFDPSGNGLQLYPMLLAEYTYTCWQKSYRTSELL